MVDEDDLSARLAGGDEMALADVMDLYRLRLVRIARFRLEGALGRRLDPDDVMQEVYISAANRLATYAEEGGKLPPFLWLRLILQQTLVDLYRRHVAAQKRDPRREIGIHDPLYPQATSTSMAIQLVGSQTSPSNAAMRAENVLLVEEALQELSPGDQEIIALRHFEELSNQETATILGIEPKAASIRYVRALQRLRKAIPNWTGDFSKG